MMTEEEPIQIVIFMTHGAGVLVPGCGHMNHVVKMPYHMFKGQGQTTLLSPLC